MGPFLTIFVAGMLAGTVLRTLPGRPRLGRKNPAENGRAAALLMLAFGELFVLAGWVYSLGRVSRLRGVITEHQAFGGGILWACCGALICVGVLSLWPISIRDEDGVFEFGGLIVLGTLSLYALMRWLQV
jgi:hypothetical protein